MRRPLIAGNWKMYKGPSEARSFAQRLLARLAPAKDCEIVVAPPLVSLTAVRHELKASPIRVAAQNCHWENEGAFTGEVSPAMLRDAGCELVLVGHSERRQFFGETDDSVNRKLRACLQAGLGAIFCLGETLDQREGGRWQNVVQTQLDRGLASLTPQDVLRIILAYEPVWAIGTGRTATPEIAEEVHAFLRQRLAWLFDKTVAESVRILYGGSVKPDNAAALMRCANIDGALVGGASLDVDNFSAIITNSIA